MDLAGSLPSIPPLCQVMLFQQGTGIRLQAHLAHQPRALGRSTHQVMQLNGGGEQCSLFQLPDGFTHDSLRAAIAQASDCSQRVQHMVLMMLVAGFDHLPLYERPADEALHLDAIAPIAKVDLKAIQAQVQSEMKAEAAERASAGKPKQADTAKPTLKAKGDKPPKTSKAEAEAAIAQAMAEVDGATANDFAPGETVRIKIDLKGPGKHAKLLPTKGRTATIDSKCGDRAWMVTLAEDPDAKDTDMVERWALIADYTELEAI